MQKIQIYTRVNQSVEEILQQHHLTATRSTFSPQTGKSGSFRHFRFRFTRTWVIFILSPRIFVHIIQSYQRKPNAVSEN